MYEDAIHLTVLDVPSGNRCWMLIKQQIGSCNDLLTLRSDRVIFYLERSEPSPFPPHSEKGGAILVVSGQHDSELNTSYQCSVTWSIHDPPDGEVPEDGRWCKAIEIDLHPNRQSLMIRCGEYASYERLFHPLTMTDIASWGVLKNRRDVAIKAIADRFASCWDFFLGFTQLVSLLSCTPYGTFCAYIIALSQGLAEQWIYTALIWLGLIVLSVLQFLPLYGLRYFFQKTIGYLNMHSMLPSGANGGQLPLWRRFSEALPPLDSWQNLRNCPDLMMVLALKLFTVVLWVNSFIAATLLAGMRAVLLAFWRLRSSIE